MTAYVFILAMFRTFFYEYFPANIQAHVWNISGAVIIINLLLICFWNFKQKLFFPILVWWVYEELLVVYSSLGRILFNWNFEYGKDLLSNHFNFPCMSLSLALCGYFAVLIYKENKRAALKP